MSCIRYIRNLLDLFCVKSGMGCIVIFGIRYIGFSLYPVSVESGLRQKKQREPFLTLKSLQETLYPVYVKSDLREIRHEFCYCRRFSLTLFTGLKNSRRS